MKPTSAPAAMASTTASKELSKAPVKVVEQSTPKSTALADLSKAEILLKLFCSTLYISAFTFGGGFVIVTFMKRKFVDELHWAEEDEMLDLTALAESCPGAIAVNAAILMGWHIAGFVGMVVAVLGTIIPPMCIITAISLCYNAFCTNVLVALVLKGMQAGVAAVILDVVCGLGQHVVKERSIVHLAVMFFAFAATFSSNINVIEIILMAAIVGIANALYMKKKTKAEAQSK
ncbi:MAG: chromate transporter [Faecalibacterium sp.]